jgi:hypothetical protein
VSLDKEDVTYEKRTKETIARLTRERDEARAEVVQTQEASYEATQELRSSYAALEEKLVVAEAAIAAAFREAANAVDKCEAHADDFDGPYYINKASAIHNISTLTPATAIHAEKRLVAQARENALKEAVHQVWDNWDVPISEMESSWLAAAIAARIQNL